MSAPLHAADIETPSVFRPTVRELDSAPSSGAKFELAAGYELNPETGMRDLKLRHAATSETLDAGVAAGSAPNFGPPANALFPDGTILVAYRRLNSRGSEIVLLRWVAGKVQKPQVLATDSWKPTGDISHTGPRIARSGARAVVTWFTATGDEPQVLAMTSSDAGESFTQAERIDVGFPTGGVDVLMLHDGTQLVSWIERRGEDASQPGGLFLRRTTAYGTTMAPALIVPAAQLASGTQPHLGLVKDYTDTAAQLSVTFNPAGQPNTNKPLLITLPETDVLLAADQGCGCAPTLAEQSGVTIRARILSVSADKKTVRLRHNAVPGLFAAGDRDYAAGPDLPADIRSGLEVLAHLDDKDGAWLLLDYRVLVMAPSGGSGRGP